MLKVQTWHFTMARNVTYDIQKYICIIKIQRYYFLLSFIQGYKVVLFQQVLDSFSLWFSLNFQAIEKNLSTFEFIRLARFIDIK